MKTYKGYLDTYRIVKEPSKFRRVQIKTAQHAYEYIKEFWSDDIEIYESMFLLTLNRSNNTTGFVKISQGGMYGTIVDVTLVAKYAIESLANSCILAHNHPSGQLRPSESDIKLTHKVKQALGYFDIQLLDHIIITKDDYYSLSNEGDI